MTQGSPPRIVALALGIALMTGTVEPAAAWNGPPVVVPIVEQLETEGYALVETRRSWLGRIVILATRDGVLREIVINRATGTVLSDRLFATAPAGTATSRTVPNRAPDGPGTGGTGTGHAPVGRPTSDRDGGNGGQ